MDTPVWLGQLAWSQPRQFPNIDANLIPPGAGLYAFTIDDATLTPGNVLYVGKADGKAQTLRTRIGVYKRRCEAFPKGRRSKHRGMEQLAEYFGTGMGPLYVRWAGVIVARDLEGSLITLFDPRFNNKDEHRYGFADDERLPDHLFTSGPDRDDPPIKATPATCPASSQDRRGTFQKGARINPTANTVPPAIPSSSRSIRRGLRIVTTPSKNALWSAASGDSSSAGSSDMAVPSAGESVSLLIRSGLPQPFPRAVGLQSSLPSGAAWA